MQIDILMKAIFKTLLTWAVFLVSTCIIGATVVYAVRFITQFIVTMHLGIIVVIPFIAVLLTFFILHVKHNYKGLIK